MEWQLTFLHGMAAHLPTRQQAQATLQLAHLILLATLLHLTWQLTFLHGMAAHLPTHQTAQATLPPVHLILLPALGILPHLQATLPLLPTIQPNTEDS